MARRAFLLAAFLGLLACGIGCDATGPGVAAQPGQAPSTEASGRRVYEVYGMNCPGCHGGLEKLVKRIPGVQQAEANWKSKQLLVTVRSGVELSDKDVHDAIRRSNFTPGKRIK